MDIYHELLGIPPEEQPPSHYRLLGIAPFETNELVILNATRRQCSFVRSVALVYTDESQRLLNELTAAKLCLLDPEKRQAYDEALRSRMAETKLPTTSREPSTEKMPEACEASAHSSAASSVAVSLGPRPAELARLTSSDPFALVGESWSMRSSSPEPASPQDAEWIVGSGADVNVRFRAPWVSRRHCRLCHREGETFLEDLGSRNGTFINEVRAEDLIPVQDDDVVTLGQKTRLPWLLPYMGENGQLEVFTIGRAPDNDLVINDKSVSKHHAQLILRGATAILYDLESRNGTRVGLFENRIERCELDPHLSVYFGRTKIFAKELVVTIRKLAAVGG